MQKTTKYLKLKEILKSELESGKYQAGESMPSERTLIQSSGYSLPTVRRAYEELAKEHYIQRIQGHGTIVLPRSAKRVHLRVGLLTNRCILNTLSRYFQSLSDSDSQLEIETVLLDYKISLEESFRLCDIVFTGGACPGDIVQQKLALPMRQYIHPENFDIPDALTQYLIDSELHVLPLTVSPIALCCNMTLLRKLKFEMPANPSIDDFLRLDQAVSRYREQTGEQIFLMPSTLSYYRWLPFIWQNGCDIFYSDNYDYDSLWKSVDFIHTLLKNGNCYLCPKAVSCLNEELFARGNFVTALISSFHFMEIYEQFKKKGIEYQIFDIPYGRRRTTCMISMPFSVSAFSREPEAAVRLCQNLLSESVQLQLFKDALLLPVIPISHAKMEAAVGQERFTAALKFIDSSIYARTPQSKHLHDIDQFSQLLAMYVTDLIKLDEFKEEIYSILNR